MNEPSIDELATRVEQALAEAKGHPPLSDTELTLREDVPALAHLARDADTMAKVWKKMYERRLAECRTLSEAIRAAESEAFRRGYEKAREEASERVLKLACRGCLNNRKDFDGEPYNHSTCRRIEALAKRLRALEPKE